jgi:Flp pilus assembly protein TadB
MATTDQPLTNDRTDMDHVRSRRAIRIMLGIGCCFTLVGVALLIAVTSPFGRAVGVVLVVWGIGTLPAARRVRRERTFASPNTEWK